MGSDGRVYRFLLQFAIPFWTRSDERTAQTNFVIDKFLRQNVVTARNFLSVQPSAAIPVAQRLRMTLDNESRVSLDDVFRLECDRVGRKFESIPISFLKEVEEKLQSQMTKDTCQEDREKLEKEIRKEIYDEICESKVDSRILLRFVHRNLGGPENLFQFRRAFAGQLATNSLMQFIFSVAERTPPRFVFLLNKAQILSPDFRVSYSNQGKRYHGVIRGRILPTI
jgi:transformation/transcription domain-associated protein